MCAGGSRGCWPFSNLELSMPLEAFLEVYIFSGSRREGLNDLKTGF